MTDEIDETDEFLTPSNTDAPVAGVGEQAAEIARLATEVARLEAETAQLKDASLRYAAEAENTRRRAEREMNDARAYAIQRFARDLLGVSDNLSRALKA